MGLQMPGIKILGGPYGPTLWIMVAFSAFHALWLILLQLIDCIAPRVGGNECFITASAIIERSIAWLIDWLIV